MDDLFVFFMTLLYCQITVTVVEGQGCSSDGEIRLVDGNSEFEGRLEVCLDRVWGTVCDDGWTHHNSAVVCRQLLGPTHDVEAYYNYFGGGSPNQRINMDNVACSGEEARLTQCSHSTVIDNCMHSEDVGVSCILISHSMAEISGNNSFHFNDTITCTDPAAQHVTKPDVDQHGQCVIYLKGSHSNPCDVYYTPGVSRVYLPRGRARNDINNLNEYSAIVGSVVAALQVSSTCRYVTERALCYYYYPPCGSITRFEPPKSLCKRECDYFFAQCMDIVRLVEIQFALQQDIIVENSLQFINCSNPSAQLDPIPHCCSNAGISRMISSPTQETSTSKGSTSVDVTQPMYTGISIITVAVVSSVVGVVILITVVIVLVIICVVVKKKERDRKSKTRVVLSGSRLTLKSMDNVKTTSDSESLSSELKPNDERYAKHALSENRQHRIGITDPTPKLPGIAKQQSARVPSFYTEKMTESNLLIPGRHINLTECIGRGEFGVVYQGHLTGWNDKLGLERVAVKTLKGTFSKKRIADLMEESLKMKSFSHPNVLNLIGVCIDAGEVPYIVMPYMANGSLLAYIREQRPKLTIADEAEEHLVIATKKQLLSMCFQIAKGMEYLALKKFVHRDLAARNCMIDINQVIKVADFGLTEDIYSRNYFRQGKAKEEDDEVKLPIRWMAPESLIDGLFNEKTDVWSFGVTCWEVFSVGRTPYPTVEPFTLVKYLEEGRRLGKPSNAACSDDVYDILMVSCWNENGADRPSFSHLVQSTNHLLDGLVDYLQLSTAVVSK